MQFGRGGGVVEFLHLFFEKKNGYIYILLQIQGNQNAGAAREEFGTPALAPVELL